LNVEGYRSEEEQVEAIKKWWRENGRSVIAGVAIGVAGILGWQGWQQYTQQRSVSGSVAYEQLLAVQDDPEQGIAQGQRLMEEFGGTGYADLAALFVAKLELQREDADAARATLRKLITDAETEGLAHVARLRLARLELAQGNGETALELLDGEAPPGFEVAYADLRGDAYVAMDAPAKAVAAYDQALAAAPEPSANRAWLEMKRDELGVSPDAE
jgi:predicted negative regulator of RcsB-dependent stress response